MLAAALVGCWVQHTAVVFPPCLPCPPSHALQAGKLDIVASAWRRMHNQHGATWELSGIPVPPLDLRVTDGAGRQIIARWAGGSRWQR